ncbi:MAG TPA: hypothetical protein VI954_00770 [Candidatus Paceibacterota bacterium]
MVSKVEPCLAQPRLSIEDGQGCAKPIEHTKQEEAVVDLVFNYPQKTDLERLSIKAQAIRRRINSPQVSREEKTRARVRLEKTEQAIKSLRRCAEMPVTAG